MRLLLDANLSPKRVGGVLERHGHDVLALASDPVLGALDDPRVLELAAGRGRILVTRNSRDFAPLLRAWAEAGRHHSGCIPIWTLAHHRFAEIVQSVGQCLDERPDPSDRRNIAIAV